MNVRIITIIIGVAFISGQLDAQTHQSKDLTKLTLDRIYVENEFNVEWLQPFQWSVNEENYLRIETNTSEQQEIAIYPEYGVHTPKETIGFLMSKARN